MAGRLRPRHSLSPQKKDRSMHVACLMDCFLGVQGGSNGEALPPQGRCWVVASDEMADVVWNPPPFLRPILSQAMHSLPPLLILPSRKQYRCRLVRVFSASLYHEKVSECRTRECLIYVQAYS